MTNTVTITLSIKEARQIDNGLSDLLCWLNGFQAAREGTDLSNSVPMGVESLRQLRTKLNNQLPSSEA